MDRLLFILRRCRYFILEWIPFVVYLYPKDNMEGFIVVYVTHTRRRTMTLKTTDKNNGLQNTTAANLATILPRWAFLFIFFVDNILGANLYAITPTVLQKIIDGR